MNSSKIDQDLYKEVQAKRDAALKNAKDTQAEVEFYNQLLEELKPKKEVTKQRQVSGIRKNTVR